MILNLKKLNQSVEYKHFKMEMLHHTIKLMTKEAYMASIDFKGAHYSFPIHPSYLKNLKVIFDGQLYCFTAFANGLTPCPSQFTKLMKPVLAELRIKGTLVTGFIHDSLLVDTDYISCMNSIIEMISLADSLGFVVHPVKSVLQPTQVIVYLEFVIIIIIIYPLTARVVGAPYRRPGQQVPRLPPYTGKEVSNMLLVHHRRSEEETTSPSALGAQGH